MSIVRASFDPLAFSEPDIQVIERMGVPNQGEGDAVAGEGIWYAWDAIAEPRPPARGHEIHLATEDSAGVISAPTAVGELSPSGELRTGPAIARLGSNLAMVMALASGITVTFSSGDETLRHAREMRPWGLPDVIALDDRRMVISWSEIDPDGYASTMLMITSRSEVLAGPVRAMSRLSSPAVMAVHEGDVWLAGFERDLSSLSTSRLRVVRRSTEDLATAHPDRAFSGWGGIQPLESALVVWDGAVWLTWIGEDARYPFSVGLFAEALPEDACTADDVEPLGILDVDLSAVPREGGMRAAASPDGLFVAHVAGPGAAFDLHRIESCAP